jgi:signal transduction histidine kinase
MRISIRYQLLLPLLTLLLGVIGISTWTAFASARRARQQIDAQVGDIIATVQESTFPLSSENVLLLMKGFSGADYLFTKGQRRWTTLPTTDVALPEDLLHAAGAGTLSHGQRVTVVDKIYLGGGVRLQKGVNAGGDLYIFYPESLWRDALWEAVRPSLILGAFGGLASVVLTVGLGQRLSRRIVELERRTRLIAAGDFSPMPLPHRHDELRDLSRSVNDMVQQLTRLQDTVRKTEQVRLLGQVSGGLAHQMRNGVTGARLAVQLHARECRGPADAEALQVALRQLALVEMHLKQFLSLGRDGDMRREPCDLVGVLCDTVTLMTPQARHARIELRWQAPNTPATVRGDAGHLGQVFLNVLTNALEAAGPGGRVEVQLQTTGPEREKGVRHLLPERPDGCFAQKAPEPFFPPAQAVVEVLDSGPGPPPGVADRLFEPFVTGKPDGIGLGLAVARRIVEAHGGAIAWSRTEARTCFRITLPLEPCA